MKVLLVNPDYEIERYMGRHFGRMGWVMPPMGLLYLAAELEHQAIEVEVYDAQIEQRSLATALTEGKPEIVGITCATALVESTLNLLLIMLWILLPIYAMPGELMAMGEVGIPYSAQEVLVNGGLAGSFFLVGFYRAQGIILARFR